jgi:hypothetical protein
MAEDIERVTGETPNDETAPNPRIRAAIDVFTALAVAVAVVAVFQIAWDWPKVSLGKSVGFFVFGFYFPILAPGVDFRTAIYLAAFIGLFWAVVRYIPTPYRIFALAVAIVGFEVYGMWCLMLVTGGA